MSPAHPSGAVARRSHRRAASVSLLAALLLGGAACARTSVSTFRWGGQTMAGRYLVNMGSLKHAGSRVDFAVIFVPEPTAQHPAFSKIYVRTEEWIDCASGMEAQSSSQPFMMSGLPIGLKDGPVAAPKPIRPGSTWSSVRALVCTGHNDIATPPLTGTDASAAAQARVRMAAHPLVDAAATP